MKSYESQDLKPQGLRKQVKAYETQDLETRDLQTQGPRARDLQKSRPADIDLQQTPRNPRFATPPATISTSTSKFVTGHCRPGRAITRYTEGLAVAFWRIVRGRQEHYKSKTTRESSNSSEKWIAAPLQEMETANSAPRIDMPVLMGRRGRMHSRLFLLHRLRHHARTGVVCLDMVRRKVAT